MTSRVIQSAEDETALITLLQARKKPYTVNIKAGKDRSHNQNRTMWMWMQEAHTQLHEYTTNEYQGLCKHHFGVPILYGEDEDYRAWYDAEMKPKPYEEQVKMMTPPYCVPVTSLMKTGQFKRFLDDVYGHFTSRGVLLTDPGEF